MQTVVKNNQSLLDIAIQVSGSAEAAFDIALANNINITAELQTGQTLQIPISGRENRQIVSYYKINGIEPATAITGIEDITMLGEGIEFWAIEYDFTIDN
jgi:hypothetical protein